MIAARAVPVERMITPGIYLRLRREAAGVTIAEAARAYAHSTLGSRVTELLLEEAERDKTTLGEPGLRRLQKRFPFDVSIYLSLAQDIRVPSICRGCGCSWDDACHDAATGTGCRWADVAETICNVCVAEGRRP